MEDDTLTKKYMDHIRTNPKFKPDGKLDAEGFYIQSDQSIFVSHISIGFFDPDGFYFNTHGYDEMGGYYGQDGVYRETDFEGDDHDEYAEIYGGFVDEADPVLASINGAVAGTKFVAVLTNLPYRVTPAEIEAELKKLKIVYQKVEVKRDAANKVKDAEVTITQKESAVLMCKMNSKDFLGRRLFVEFPDMDDLATKLAKVNLAKAEPKLTRPMTVQLNKHDIPVPLQASGPTVEKAVVKEEDKTPNTAVTVKEEVKVAKPAPQESKPIAESASVWAGSPEEILKEFSTGGKIVGAGKITAAPKTVSKNKPTKTKKKGKK